ncbi:MAG: hypothetical protein LKK19_06945 [Bacteroidales bacterium]|nr:hypothetical protein [Bacteroidales bacterium]MCI2122421.1 hypothetical protein [Bacteroidales bacterium]MCI2144785.1 hypothetical protein [Bacteroidales bacterium]
MAVSKFNKGIIISVFFFSWTLLYYEKLSIRKEQVIGLRTGRLSSPPNRPTKGNSHMELLPKPNKLKNKPEQVSPKNTGRNVQTTLRKNVQRMFAYYMAKSAKYPFI